MKSSIYLAGAALTFAAGLSLVGCQTSRLSRDPSSTDLQQRTGARILRGLASNSSGLARSPDPLARGFVLSANKQGVGDAYRDLPDDVFAQRYSHFKEMQTGVKIYNIWWSEMEGAGVRGSSAPVSCPGGFTMFPANETEKRQKGFKHYHCYRDSSIATFDRLMRLDAQNGIQSAAILWSSPEMYRIPGCKGFVFADNRLYDGCVPNDSSMDDWEDYVRFLGSRYNDPARGKLHHFVIWNENAAGGWFEYSPVVNTDNFNPNDSNQVRMWIDKYADMIKRANVGLRGNTSAVMIYASTDINWEAPRSASGSGHHEAHIGTRTLIEGLWARLGTDYAWSIAVHPYGDASGLPGSGQYGFANLGSLVVEFQKSQLAARGITDWMAYPQSYLIASEQGWGRAVGDAGALAFQAKMVCYAHNHVNKLPTLTGVTHNYFHSIEPAEDDPNGKSAQGAFFGLLPHRIQPSLSDMLSVPTGQAYYSTRPAVWNQSNDHYCCANHGLGCADGDVMGNVDGVVPEGDHFVIRGWACARGYEGPIAAHVYAGGPAGVGFGIGAVTANEPAEEGIGTVCETTSTAHRFRFQVSADVMARAGGKLAYVHGISPYGRSNLAIGGSGDFGIPNSGSSPSSQACVIPVSEQGYLRMNTDVQKSGLNPWLHYKRNGRNEGRCPIVGACTIAVSDAEYLELYDDVRRAGVPARQHYLSSGKNEGRCPISGLDSSSANDWNLRRRTR